MFTRNFKNVCSKFVLGQKQCYHRSSSKTENYYDVLKVSKNSTPQEIKKAYLKLAKELHPDKNNSKYSHKNFVKINEAYNVLSKPFSRQEYDKNMNIYNNNHFYYEKRQKNSNCHTQNKQKQQENYFYDEKNSFEDFFYQNEKSFNNFKQQKEVPIPNALAVASFIIGFAGFLVHFGAYVCSNLTKNNQIMRNLKKK